MKKILKWGIIIIIVLGVIGGIFGSNDTSDTELVSNNDSSTVVSETEPIQDKTTENNDETSIEKTDLETQKTVTYNYYIADEKEFHIPGAQRYHWDIVIIGTANIEDMKEISNILLEKAKDELDFNVISFGFYDYEEYIGSGYTLGQATFAPDGDWGKANTVNTGAYNKMSFSYDLLEKDWSKQLTKKEVEIFKAWHDLSASMEKNSEPHDEDLIDSKIAKEYNLQSNEVQEIRKKQTSWIFECNK